MNPWQRLVRRVRDTIWLGPTIAAVVAASMAASAWWIGRVFGDEAAVDITEDTLMTVLALFATSMLTVATFSLSAIGASAASVAASTTPRASRQVVTDVHGRVAITSFVMAFVYSVVGILLLVLFRFRETGRLALFVGLIVIVVFVLVAFIAWVDRVLHLGRQGHAIERLLTNARASLTTDTVGSFGGVPSDGTVPETGVGVTHQAVGRLVTLDVAVLERIAAERDVEIHLAARPGDTVEPTTPVMHVVGAEAHDVVRDCGDELCGALEVATQRGRDLDVRFNVLLLAETADRALSPAVNDPGTAIVILDQFLEFFVDYRQVRAAAGAADRRAPHVHVPVLRAAELVSDAFGPIARDGAGLVEVGVRLQKTLSVLCRLGPSDLADAAREMSRIALVQARAALVVDADYDAVAAESPG